MPFVHPTKDLPVKVEEYSSLGLKTTNYGEQEQQQQKTKKMSYLLNIVLNTTLKAKPFKLTSDQFVGTHDRFTTFLQANIE